MELVRFCFQDREHTMGTLILVWITFCGIESLIRAWRSRDEWRS